MSPTRAIIFDRDGTLSEDLGFTHRPQDLRLLPGVAEAVRAVNAAGWLAIVATNQSGVARGLFDETAVYRFHAHLHAALAAHGAEIDAYYHCPHHPDAIDPRYRHPDPPDRKPNPGMLLRAAADFGFAPAEAWVIGDRDSDAEAARAAGMRAAIVAPGGLLAAVEAALAHA